MTKNKTIPQKSRPQVFSSIVAGPITRVVEIPGKPRKIRANPRSFTGVIALLGGQGTVWFESTLERDLIERLDMDRGVRSITSQQLCLEFDYEGKTYTYHPDIEVECDPSKVQELPFDCDSVVIEVKPESEIQEKLLEFAPKFAAAEIYCQERGRQFVVLTEEQIRTTYLENTKRLRQHLRGTVIPDIAEFIIELIIENGTSSIEQILCEAKSLKSERPDVVDTLFALIATGVIQFHTDKLLTKDSPLECVIKSRSLASQPESKRVGGGSNG